MPPHPIARSTTVLPTTCQLPANDDVFRVYDVVFRVYDVVFQANEDKFRLYHVMFEAKSDVFRLCGVMFEANHDVSHLCQVSFQANPDVVDRSHDRVHRSHVKRCRWAARRWRAREEIRNLFFRSSKLSA